MFTVIDNFIPRGLKLNTSFLRYKNVGIGRLISDFFEVCRYFCIIVYMVQLYKAAHLDSWFPFPVFLKKTLNRRYTLKCGWMTWQKLRIELNGVAMHLI